MKDEYISIIFFMLLWLGLVALFGLIVDLFDDGTFGLLMVVTLIPWSIILTIALMIQGFKLNYKIKKR